MKHLHFIVFALLLFNCSSSRKTIEAKNKEEILNYLKKNGIENTNIIVVKDYLEYKRLSKKDSLIIPNVTFFDGEGNLIEY